MTGFSCCFFEKPKQPRSDLIPRVLRVASNLESSDSADSALSMNFENHPPEQTTLMKQLTKIARFSAKGISTLVISEGIAFISANALMGVLMSVASGYPSIAPALARDFAKYAMPGYAIPVALIASLHHIDFKKVDELYRILVATMHGLGLTAFTIPMAMEVVTRVIQLIKGESRDTEVLISDAEAIAIIAMLCFVGSIQTAQTYYKQKNDLAESDGVEKSLLNRATTHKSMQIIFGGLSGASSLHAGSVALMKLLQLDLNGTIEYDVRWGVTLLGFVAGALGHNSKTFNATLGLVSLGAIGITYTGTFYLSPNAPLVFGDVVEELTIVWSAIIPVLTTTILLLQLAGVDPNRIYEIIATMMTNVIQGSKNTLNQLLCCNDEETYSLLDSSNFAYNACSENEETFEQEEDDDDDELNRRNDFIL